MSSETTSNNFNKTIVILGPTGSGKTGVSIKIAKEMVARLFRRIHVRFTREWTSAPLNRL